MHQQSMFRQSVRTLPIRTCTGILILARFLSSKRFPFDGKRASSLEKAKALFLEERDQIESADALISPVPFMTSSAVTML
jgi:hypothetical protein